MKRSKQQIVHDILTAIENKPTGAKPTHILYKANLSHQAMTKYLSELLDSGLIAQEHAKERRTYVLTQKGRLYLLEYRRFSQFSDAFGLS